MSNVVVIYRIMQEIDETVVNVIVNFKDFNKVIHGNVVLNIVVEVN